MLINCGNQQPKLGHVLIYGRVLPRQEKEARKERGDQKREVDWPSGVSMDAAAVRHPASRRSFHSLPPYVLVSVGHGLIIVEKKTLNPPTVDGDIRFRGCANLEFTVRWREKAAAETSFQLKKSDKGRQGEANTAKGR